MIYRFVSFLDLLNMYTHTQVASQNKPTSEYEANRLDLHVSEHYFYSLPTLTCVKFFPAVQTLMVRSLDPVNTRPCCFS